MKSGSRRRGSSCRTSSGTLRWVRCDLAVVGVRGVEQQQRVAGRRRIDDDEPSVASGHVPGEGAEDGDLLGAGRAEILGEQRAPLRVEVRAGRRHDLLAVALGLDDRIDTRRLARRSPSGRSLPPRGRPDRWW